MAAAESEAFYSSLSSSPRLMGRFESESNFNSLFMVRSGCDYEHNREASFSFWPPGVPLPGTIKDLVNAGFHYTGNGVTIACYSCKVQVQSWEDGADPLDVHWRLSPNCHHLRSLKEKGLRNERINKRRKSPKTSRQNAAIPNSSCLGSCSQTLSSSSSSQQSTCNTSLDNCQNRVSAQEEQKTRVLQRCQPDSGSLDNDLTQRERRLQTFSASCPRDVLQVKLSLADAGFFYTGRNDVVKCAFCSGELHTAKIGGSPPWESHVKFFPDCSFARNYCQSMTNQAAERELPEKTREHIVKPAKNQTSKSSNTPSSDHLLCLKAENEKLRTSVTCMQCRSAQIQILMLPCCHIVCCEVCADILDDCPLCTAQILGTVKVFMS